MFTFKQSLPKEIKCISVLFFVPIGLFNISDKLLVSLDILLEWREEFKRGDPPQLPWKANWPLRLRRLPKFAKPLTFNNECFY